jgi:hypothetical protein
LPAAALAQRATTTVVTVSPNPAQIGGSVQIKAQVSYTTSVTSAIYPGGTVNFTAGGAAISGCDAVALANGAAYGYANASCTASFSQAGAVAIGANYGGDSGSAASAGSASLTIASATTVTIALKSGYPQIGQVVTLTATVSSEANFPLTGAVNFTANGSALPGCSNVPVAPGGGTATCAASFTQTGAFSIGAAYSGDTKNTAVAGSMQLTVGKAYATPYIASYVLGAQSNGQYYASQAVTIGVKFAQAPSVPAPTGTATFKNGGSVLAVVPVSASTCDITGYACAKIVAPGDVAALAPGTYSITADYSGDSNYGASTTPVHAVSITKTPTTPYLTSNPDTGKAAMVAGEPLILGAAFTPPPGSAVPPGGAVTFYDGASALATVPLDATGHAQMTATLPVGGHSVKATYGGDTIYLPADTSTPPAGLLNFTVNKAGVTLVFSASPFQPGKPVTIAATPVIATSGMLGATGTFDFSTPSGSIAGCTGLTTGDTSGAQHGYAQCTATLAQAGAVTVTYSGDANTAGASATVVLNAGKALPGIYAESVNPTPVLGEGVTVDVRLVGPLGFAGPTGTVAFADGSAGGASLGSAAIAADGHALLVLPPGALAMGDHNIKATYSGDDNYESGSSLPLLITVKPDPTIVVASAPMSTLGQPLSVTVAVAVPTPGTATPGGAVYIYGAGGSLAATCSPTVLNGTAQCTARIAVVDTLNPKINYTADNNTAASTVQPAFSSARATAGMFLDASSPSPAYGMLVTVTAVLIGAPGTSPPTGTVSFLDNGTPLGTAPVANGRAALPALSTLAMGSHSITALYGGDANYAPSVSPASATVAVTKAVAKLDLAATPAQAGQQVTLKASVTVLGPGTPVTAGTVDFSTGGAAIPGCSGVALQNGVAQCATTFSQLGAITVTASYSGSATTTAIVASLEFTVGRLKAGFFLSAYSTSLPYGAGVGIRALVMGTPAPTGTVTFSDGASALATVPLAADGSAPLAIPSGAIPALAVGTHNLSAAYSGDANYQAATQSGLAITIVKASTNVAIYAAAPQINQPSTLKAAVTVVSPGVAGPTGTVEFDNGASIVPGCSAVKLQSGAALCTTTFTTLGTYTITAKYSGDATTLSGSAAMQLTAGKAVAGIYVASEPTAPVYGAPVTLRALLLGAAGVPPPTGNVTFSDGAAPLGAAAVGGDGYASVTFAGGVLAAGQHLLTASYAGDANYGTGSAAEAVVVGQASTSTTISASFGAPLTATVNVLAPGAGTPTGAVQFFVAGALVGTQTLTPKNGSFVATLPAGSWSGSTWAVYQGDANFAGSASATASVAPSAVVSISSDHNPAVAGQAIVLTVSVTPASGTVAPTGKVQVSVDGAVLGSALLASGSATFTAADLGVGSHTVVASYAGDAVYPAASATLVQLVSKSLVSLTLTASAATAAYGQPVTFTAAAAGVSGTVQFSDGQSALGSASITAGSAELTVANLGAGSHSIVATWAGDAGTSAAISAPLPFTVGKAQTVTLLSSSGQALRAVVTPVAPGAGTPSGPVSFVDAANGSVFAGATLSGGVAAASQPLTGDAIVAVYSGDANFAGSTSAALSPLAAANAASFAADNVAPDEIVTLFGTNLSGVTVASTAAPAATLGGATVSVTDSAGARHAANLLFISPSQASIVMPPDVPAGPAAIAIATAAGAILTAPVTVAQVAPGLFTADGSGRGAPVGQTLRVHEDGTQDAPADLSTGPIDVAGGDTVYLVLYGTGVRHKSSTTVAFRCAACTSGDWPVAFAGAQPSVAGLDQVNVALPAWLAGAGKVTLVLTVDGVTSNPVDLTFR